MANNFEYSKNLRPYLDNGGCTLLKVTTETVRDFLNMNGGIPFKKADCQRYQHVVKLNAISRVEQLMDSMRATGEFAKIRLSNSTGDWRLLDGGHTVDAIWETASQYGDVLLDSFVSVYWYDVKSREAECALFSMFNSSDSMSAQDKRNAIRSINPENTDLLELARVMFEAKGNVKNVPEEFKGLFNVMQFTAASNRGTIVQALENVVTRMVEFVNNQWYFGFDGICSKKPATDSMYKNTNANERKQALLKFAEIMELVENAVPWFRTKEPIEACIDMQKGVKVRKAGLITKLGAAAGIAANEHFAIPYLRSLKFADYQETLNCAELLHECLTKCSSYESGSSSSKTFYDAQKQGFNMFFSKQAKK